MSSASKNIRRQRWVVIAGITLLTTKFAAFILTHSNAILTDSVESIVNVVASLIGLYSLRLSAKPRDADHPYGHGKVEFISASIEGALITFAGIFILGKVIFNFFHPYVIGELNTGIVLIASTIGVNFFLGTLCVTDGKKSDSLALISSGKHLQADAVSSLGIIAALLLIVVTGFTLLDSIIATALGIYIIITGYKLIRKAIAGIMDEADYDLLKKIIAHLNDKRNPQQIDLHNMRVIKYGPVLHIDCHLTVPYYFNVNEAHLQVDAVVNEVAQSVTNPVEFFIHTDGCVPPQMCRICIMNECKVRERPFGEKIEWNINNVLQNKKHGL